MRKLTPIVIAVLLFFMPGCTAESAKKPDTAAIQTRESVPEATAATAPPTETYAPEPAPEPDFEPSFRVVFMADSRGTDRGINSKVVRKTLEAVKQLDPQPVMAYMPGDLVDGAKSYKDVKTQLEYFKKTITEYYPESFFFPGLGNHEISNSSGGEKAFAEVFSSIKADAFLEGYGKTVYYTDCGKSRLFMLNTDFPGEMHKISDRQLDWVKANLSEDGGNLFFMHEPPYPTGANIGFSLDKYPLQRAKLWKLIDSAFNPMVFCSHEHNYSRRHIDSSFNTSVAGIPFIFEKTVYQLTSGGFGAPFYKQYESKKNVDVPPITENHFVVIDLKGTEIAVSVYNLDGKLLDHIEQKG